MTDSAALVAQITDPHVRAGGRDREAAEALSAAVRAVRRLEPLPHAVVVTGDLVDRGTAREYERVRELLAPLELPLHVVPGNHDDRDGLRDAFGPALPGTRAGDPYQWSARCGALRIVGLDTTLPGFDEGAFDAARRAWLQAELAAEPDTPTLLVMHHPPLPIGMPGLDAIGLPGPDRRAFAAVVGAAPQVRRIACGHVHRSVVGSVGACPVLALSSSWVAAKLEIGAPDFEMVREPPSIALHALVDGEVLSHLQPV